MVGRLLIALLSVLPKHLMSHVAGWWASRTIPGFLRPLVYQGFCAIFGARAQDAAEPFSHYPSLNAFFTRALKPGLRPVAPNALVSPVDAAVGAWGELKDDVLFQAKGRTYSLGALVGDAALAKEMLGGTYATLYLAPKDYHRIHIPVGGEIVKATYIPGELWPVNKAAVAHVDQLFAVNERMVVEIRRPNGGVMVAVAVGATMVGMTRVVFDDLHTNAKRRSVDARVYQPGKPVEAGGPLDHFEFGSTVILACSANCGRMEELTIGSSVQVGQRLGPLA